MPACATCGNVYDKAFQVTFNGETYTFDSFECAAHKLAPVCEHCKVRILGHGLEAEGGRFFCCDQRAEHAGVKGLRDRL